MVEEEIRVTSWGRIRVRQCGSEIMVSVIEPERPWMAIVYVLGVILVAGGALLWAVLR